MGQRYPKQVQPLDDEALVKAISADHPDGASMIIIKAVWKALRESESL